MIRRFVDFALNNRLLVLALALLLFAWGVISFKNLPVEAYPDVANNYVQVITQWPGRAAEEVEQQVTIPLEIVMNGLPHLAAFAVGIAVRPVQRDADLRRRVGERLEPRRRSWSASPKSRCRTNLQPQMGTDYSPGGTDLLLHADQHQSGIRRDGTEVARRLGDRETVQVRAERGGRIQFRRPHAGSTRCAIDPDKLVSYGLSIGQSGAATAPTTT